MLKLKDLIVMSEDVTRDRSRSVAVYSQKAILDLEGTTVFKYYEFQAKDFTTDGGPKNMVVRLYGLNKDPLNDEAWVSCDCEHFLYNLEVANAFHDSSSVIFSNGNAPVEKNPNMMPGLCKHLLAAVKRINSITVNDPHKLNTEE